MQSYIKQNNYFSNSEVSFKSGESTITINFIPGDLSENKVFNLSVQASVLYNTDKHSCFIEAHSAISVEGSTNWTEKAVQNLLDRELTSLVAPVLKKVTLVLYSLFDAAESFAMVPDLLEVVAQNETNISSK